MSGMYQIFKDAGTLNCQALDLDKMPQSVKKAIKMSIMTQIVNVKRGKIKLLVIWRIPCWEEQEDGSLVAISKFQCPLYSAKSDDSRYEKFFWPPPRQL